MVAKFGLSVMTTLHLGHGGDVNTVT